MVDFAVDPAKTAFVNVDMQCCFVEGFPISAPEGPVVLERINKFAEVCRDNGVTVIHTAHLLRPDHSNIGLLGEVVPPVKEGVIDEGSESGALHKGLVIAESDIILHKPRFGAFHGTDLELILRSKGIDTIIVSGIATNVCCETTAREGNVRDFKVLFLSDGTATFDFPDAGWGVVTHQELQKATCTTLAMAFAQVLTCEQAAQKISVAVHA